MNKHILLAAGLALAFASANAQEVEQVKTCDDVILHCWSWSFNTIRENMADIAAAGYTCLQTSPAQHCVTETRGDKGGGNKLFGKGYWYYHYQPTDWKIGNYQLGTREDLQAMCAEAAKYGIRVIVDVLPNHTSVDDTRVSDDLDAAVGGHENLYHANGFTAIRDYNDRYQCTSGEMGGLPDVNTENPDFQYYYMTYVNDLLACGVRGFRYDTAKHIALPSDPKDEKSPENNFWPVATGRQTVKGLRLALPEDSLFIYGEVLQDQNVKETEYAEFISMTASSMGGKLRHVLDEANWHADDVWQYSHPVDPSKLVTWVESHDTYCNEHESAHLSDAQIRLGWVYLVSRTGGNPLFYDRPDGSDGPAGNWWGNNIVGAKGNDNFKHPVVVAANKFRHQMQNQPEYLSYSDDNAVVVVSRGKKGAVVINLSNEPQDISIYTTLRHGKYKDAVSGKLFRVSKTMLKGQLEPLSAYVLTRN